MFRKRGKKSGASSSTEAEVAAGRPAGKQKRGKKPLIRTLEPRMVFDAAAVATVDQAVEAAHQEPVAVAQDHSVADAAWSHLSEALKDAPVTPDSRPSSEPVAAVAAVDHVSIAPADSNSDFWAAVDGTGAASASDAVPPKEIFFVWDNVEDWQQIVANLGDSARVHVIDSSQDGVEQLAALLDGESNVTAIHLISHGTEGRLNLGAAVLDADSMQDQYLDELTAIGQATTSSPAMFCSRWIRRS